MPRTPGRNDKCPCGSGKKYKQCCEGKGPNPWGTRVMVGLVLATILGALYAGVASFYEEPSSTSPAPGKVWSPEHGHYH